jgi:hypothetical protein
LRNSALIKSVISEQERIAFNLAVAYLICCPQDPPYHRMLSKLVSWRIAPGSAFFTARLLGLLGGVYGMTAMVALVRDRCYWPESKATLP